MIKIICGNCGAILYSGENLNSIEYFLKKKTTCVNCKAVSNGVKSIEITKL